MVQNENSDMQMQENVTSFHAAYIESLFMWISSIHGVYHYYQRNRRDDAKGFEKSKFVHVTWKETPNYSIGVLLRTTII